MVTLLEKLISDIIRNGGPIRMDEFMSLALAHPDHGYYMTRDPFGKKGDFVTAPEVSQLFGEMLAAWCMHTWVSMGKPDNFELIECGPGRGTLMADLLRTAKMMPDFFQAASIHLVETSPVLREKQKQTLKDYDKIITWHDDIDSIPEKPFILLANEFLDALPIRQFVCSAEGWVEQCVGLSPEGSLVFFPIPMKDEELELIPERVRRDKGTKKTYEYSPAVDDHIRKISQRVANHNGYALYIDYGYLHTSFNSTIQSVKNHRQSGLLKNAGEQDITAFVNFSRIKKIADPLCQTTAVTSQRQYLQRLGIEIRADVLARQAVKDHERLSIRAGLGRLIASEQMGNLFKVICLYPNNKSEPEGFINNADQ